MRIIDKLFRKQPEDLTSKIQSWLVQIEKQEELPDDIVAICIGLFEGESTYQIYFIASKEYDSEDDDWACNQDFEPKFKYLDSGIKSSNDWTQFQSKVSESIKNIMTSNSSKFLQKVDHVSVGFDSGELEKIK